MSSLLHPTPESPVPPRRLPRALALLSLVALALLVYLPSALRATYLNFDDNFFFGPDNPVFARALAAAQANGLFAGLAIVLDPSSIIADVWLPVAHGSLFVDAYVSGQAVASHIHSALLHGLAAYVLWRLLLSCRIAAPVAAGAAACFVVHPALCESVAWASGRKDVLSGLFVFAALLQVARSCERFTVGRLLAAMLFTVLAMYAKATAVVLPLLAALLCAYLGGPRQRWWGPLWLLVVTLPIAWHHQSIAAAIGTMVAQSPWDRLVQVPGVYLHYACTTVWPLHLNVLYPEVQTLERFRGAWLPGTVALLAALAFASIGFRRPGLRASALGVVGFGLALLPFNTAYPASSLAAADRYLYLAVPFAAVALLSLPLPRRATAALATLLTAVLAVLALLRASAFASSEALWNASVVQDPQNAVAWLNRAQALLFRGSLDVKALPEVTRCYERAAASARYPEHERNARLGQMQMALFEGDYEAAAGFASQAIAAAERIGETGRARKDAARAVLVQTLLYAITPMRACGRMADAQNALARAEQLLPDASSVVAASVLLAADDLAAVVRKSEPPTPLASDDARAVALRARLDQALAALDASEAQDPTLAAALARDRQLLHLAAGKLERLRGNRMQALRSFRLAIDAVRQQQRADPEAAESYLGAAEVCLDAGLYPDAEGYANQGVGWFVERGITADARLRHARARSLAGQGRLDDAIVGLSPYCDQHPGDRDAARLLSSLLMGKATARLSDQKVKPEELQDLIDRALKVNPTEPRVDLIRARLLRDRGKYQDAVAALDRAREHLPEFEDGMRMLADNLRDLGYQRMLAKDDDGAAAAWRRFLALVGEDPSVEAVQLQLGAIWRRAEQKGVDAMQAKDLAEAERQFRRCLSIDPKQHWASWHLVKVLLQQPTADPAELDRYSQQALGWCQAQGLDRSRQTLVRAMVLEKLHRSPEAIALVAAYLAGPDAGAPPEVLQALRNWQDKATSGK